MDSQLDRFEEAWDLGNPPAIDEFLQAVPEADRRNLLIELLKIDLERRWRSAAKQPAASESLIPPRPLLEDYARIHSQLTPVSELPLDLITEEYRVRQRWGDRPDTQDYVERFQLDPKQWQNAVHEIAPTPVEGPGTRSAGARLRSVFDTRKSQPENERQREQSGAGIAKRRGPGPEVVGVLRDIRAPYIVGMRQSEVHPDGTARLVADEISGTDLQERMAAGGAAIPEETALEWMKQACEGLTYIAARKIVHRNLKPSNIVIDENSAAHVINFDQAVIAGVSDGPAGTPAYAAPEQFVTPTIVDERSDIYSLGATFYHAMTGHFPDAKTKVRFVPPVTEPLPPSSPTTAAPKLSDTTIRLLERCNAPQPGRRFQSFVELMTQLENLTKDIHLHDLPPDLPSYHLLSCLGEGGMGVVFKAQCIENNRRVALKFIRVLGARDIDLLVRFRIEAEAVACLRHPNIVPILDIGVSGGCPYFALEYVDGGSIHDRLGEFQSDPVRCAEVMQGVATGLHHSHRLGILHRDLKPQNILLTREGTPKISDFGLAKFMVSGEIRERLRSDSIRPGIHGSLMRLDQFVSDGAGPEQNIAERAQMALAECNPESTKTVSLDVVQQFVTTAIEQATSGDFKFQNMDPTQPGEILGTPAYMAPEQTLGDARGILPATDVYALGVVLYQMLSGQVPFRAKSIGELFDQIQNRPPESLPGHHPPRLIQICLRCLAKKPEDRFLTAGGLSEALGSFLSHQNQRPPERKKWWWF